MSPECGPWRSCDFHQYRCWLRKTESAPPSSTPTDKEKQKIKKVRRRPTVGDFQLTFRHHSDPAEYERDYLTQVTQARCRAANPAAALLATELMATRSPAPAAVQPVVEPPAPPSADRPSPAPERPLQTASSSPDLLPPPPPPVSAPDLRHLPRITVGGRPPRRRSLPPSSAAAAPAAAGASTAAYRRPVAVGPSPVAQGEEGEYPPPSGLRYHRPPPPTPQTVTLDLPSPIGFGGAAQARRGGHKPRGLTKIQLASSVPENLTIIVGRKLEISLSGARRGRQKSRGSR